MIIDQVPFVILDDVLILEFAYFVKNWVDDFAAGVRADFYYRSMDEEEEPLLALYGRRDGTYSVASCWSAQPIRQVESAEAVTAFKAFLMELKNELQRNYGLEIDLVFSAFK